MKKRNLKSRRNFSIAALSLLFIMAFGSICYAYGAGSASKKGNYCQVTGAFVNDSTDSTKIFGNAYIKNLYSGTVYTTLTLKTYTSSGSLVNTYSYSDVLSNNGTLYSNYLRVSKTYTVKATGSVYRSSSSGSGQLETVTITIN